jgi:hypothetical protein
LVVRAAVAPSVASKPQIALHKVWGLIADRVWLTDTISERVVEFGRATNKKLDALLLDVLVLSRLWPLIRAGVVRFRSPFMVTCSSCAEEFQRHVEEDAIELARVLRDFRLERRDDGGAVFYTGKSFDPPAVFRLAANRLSGIDNARNFAGRWVPQRLRSAYWVAREASMTGGPIASNSRIGLSGLLLSEGRLVDKATLLLGQGAGDVDSMG